MDKAYRCDDCGSECQEPVYLRLHLTRCGWSRASGRRRWQRSVRVGRFCVPCLLKRVRTVTGSEAVVLDLGASLAA